MIPRAPAISAHIVAKLLFFIESREMNFGVEPRQRHCIRHIFSNFRLVVSSKAEFNFSS